MSPKTYVPLSSLKNYNNKINNVLNGKQEQLEGLEGQILSFDATGKAVPKNFEEVGEKNGEFITREEYEELVKNNLIEENKNYYIVGNPINSNNEIEDLQIQINDLKNQLNELKQILNLL